MRWRGGLAGSEIDATGANLTLGDATKGNGFYGNGTIDVGSSAITLADANDAALDSASLGAGGTPGTLNAANGLTLDFGGNLTGYVKGVGTFDNVNFTGAFSPGLSPTISTVGSIAFSPTSTLVMELGGAAPGSGYDQILSSGVLALDGTLQISLFNGFLPAAG